MDFTIHSDGRTEIFFRREFPDQAPFKYYISDAERVTVPLSDLEGGELEIKVTDNELLVLHRPARGGEPECVFSTELGRSAAPWPGAGADERDYSPETP